MRSTAAFTYFNKIFYVTRNCCLRGVDLQAICNINFFLQYFYCRRLPFPAKYVINTVETHWALFYGAPISSYFLFVLRSVLTFACPRAKGRKRCFIFFLAKKTQSHLFGMRKTIRKSTWKLSMCVSKHQRKDIFCVFVKKTITH